MTLPPINTEFLLKILTDLLNIPSPTGYTQQAIAFTQKAFESLPGIECYLTRKGALVASLQGQRQDAPRALTAHVDTLGALVKEIKENGRLKLTAIGGLQWPSVETEGCFIFTHMGKHVRGSLLSIKASTHVYGKDGTNLPRDSNNMEVRLDDRTTSAKETRALGIEVGDFVAFDPRIEVTNGFVRSRYLDDKACVACVVTAAKAIRDAGLTPSQTTFMHISNFEEVGHGASAGIPSEVTELIVVDMAAVGEGQSSDEFHATLCIKDSGGPYEYHLNQRMRQLAEQHHFPYKVDIYPNYRSDGGALWHAGGDVAVALIGPGVDASHNYERTHVDALIATTQWILAYMLS